MATRPEGIPADDTSREALRRRFAALRRLSPRERLALMDDLTGLARALTREGLRRRHPEATPAEIEEMFADQVLGRETAARVREHRRGRRNGPAR